MSRLTSADYRAKAEECQRQADASTDEILKPHWSRLARRWQIFAARIAESERVMGRYNNEQVANEKPRR